MGCGARPVACDTTGLHFTADLVVDSRGRAYMLEAHVTLGVKAYGCALRRERAKSNISRTGTKKSNGTFKFELFQKYKMKV